MHAYTSACICSHTATFWFWDSSLPPFLFEKCWMETKRHLKTKWEVPQQETCNSCQEENFPVEWRRNPAWERRKKLRDGDKKWWEWQTGQSELYNTGHTHGSETFKINHFEFDMKVRRRCTLMMMMWCQPASSSSLMVPWKPPSWGQKIGTDRMADVITWCIW